jgi:hypothetical protein
MSNALGKNQIQNNYSKINKIIKKYKKQFHVKIPPYSPNLQFLHILGIFES